MLGYETLSFTTIVLICIFWGGIVPLNLNLDNLSSELTLVIAMLLTQQQMGMQKQDWVIILIIIIVVDGRLLAGLENR
ncbi:hypothetical protein FKM82_007654 [Ascaphus truei]